MRSDLAIATVTATLKRVLESAVAGRVQGASTTITIGQPDKDATTSSDSRVNIFLYQVTHNSGWRNADLPTRRADGSISQRPMLALDLHYLLSFYGDKSKLLLLPERLMGLVMKTLHTQPILTRQIIRETLAAQDYSFLAESSLAEQPELVKFSPISLSLEELAKIWSIFFQTQYVLSMAYQGTVVLIESENQPIDRLPVSDRTITVDATLPPAPIPLPTITQIHTQTGEPITAGSTLLIQGQALTRTAIASIQIADQTLSPTAQTIQDREIYLTLPNSFPAGVKPFQIIYQNGDRSNLANFILHPQIVSVVLQSQLRQIELTLNLPIVAAQQIEMRFSQQASEANIPLSWVTSEPVEAGGAISIPLPDQTVIHPGYYTVQLQIDGAESPTSEVIV